MIGIRQMSSAGDTYIVANAAIFIYDGIFNFTVFANAQFWNISFKRMCHLRNGFIIIATHNV